jgi:hypothetical protein
MTFEELLKLDSNGDLLAIYQEATAYRVILKKTGKPGRIIRGTPSAEARYADRDYCSPDPNYCADELWDNTAAQPARGVVSIKHLLKDFLFNNPTICGDYGRRYDWIMDKVRSDMPPCQHEGECFYGTTPLPPKTPGTIDRHQLRVTKDGKVVKDTTPPVRFLEAMLEHPWGSDEAAAEKPLAGLKQDPITGLWTWKLPEDEGDPIYIVKSEQEALRLYEELDYQKRIQEGKISPRYARESIFICGPHEREFVLSADVTKENLTGYLSYKPVVLTFTDPELEDKLARVCTAVAVVPPIEPKLTYEMRQQLTKYSELHLGMPQNVWELIIQDERWFPTLAAFRAPFKKVAGLLSSEVPDMPEEVLDGRLGEICRTRMAMFPRAFAWPALLAAASVLVPKSENEKIRANIYVSLIGPPGSGKSSSYDYAFWLLGLADPILQRLKSGSAEGLAQHIGDVGSAARLFYPDELAHLLKKAAIEGSTFPQTLNTLYYHDKNEATIAHGKLVTMNCRLTLAGGIPAEEFGDLFGTGTIGGFYDRFIFAECPTGFTYNYRPFEGEPVFQPQTPSEENDPTAFSTAADQPVVVEIDRSVWAECDKWRAAGLGRVVEHSIRVAIICASFDGRRVLRAEDLAPALAFAKYQMRMRKVFEPNPGKNTDGILTWKVQRYLDAHAPKGEWLNKRVMLQSIRAWDFGATTIERVLHGLQSSGAILMSRNGRQVVIRLNIERLD